MFSVKSKYIKCRQYQVSYSCRLIPANQMSQSDEADAPCLKFYFLYNPNMLLFNFLNFQLSMSICTCLYPSGLVVATWDGNYSGRKLCKMASLHVC